jgi:hypothetical protein
MILTFDILFMNYATTASKLGCNGRTQTTQSPRSPQGLLAHSLHKFNIQRITLEFVVGVEISLFIVSFFSSLHCHIFAVDVCLTVLIVVFVI